ncbi:MAG: hypothetical protein AVDCRST_MAG73-3114, partial [uncultured Thermomicrobiales bacterium]
DGRTRIGTTAPRRSEPAKNLSPTGDGVPGTDAAAAGDASLRSERSPGGQIRPNRMRQGV